MIESNKSNIMELLQTLAFAGILIWHFYRESKITSERDDLKAKLFKAKELLKTRGISPDEFEL